MANSSSTKVSTRWLVENFVAQRSANGEAGEPFTVKLVAEQVERSESTVRKALVELVERGNLEAAGRGKFKVAGQEPKKSATRGTQVRAKDVAEQVFEAIREHGGDEGVTLAQLSEATGIRGRVLSNVVWTLEGKPGAKTETEARVKNVSGNRTKRLQVIG